MVVCLVYGLRSSRDARVRYIGQTTKSVEARLAKHHEAARLKVRRRVYNWMRSEMDAGHTIDAVVLDANAEWSVTERAMIAAHENLVNGTAGGDGALGYEPTVEQRARMSAAQRGKRRSAASIAKGVETRRRDGTAAMTERTKVALRAANIGKKLSPEAIAKRTETRRLNGGFVQSEEQRAARSATIAAWWANRKGLAHVA